MGYTGASTGSSLVDVVVVVFVMLLLYTLFLETTQLQQGRSPYVAHTQLYKPLCEKKVK